MMAFVPLNSHPNPQNVLVIGGGDGGVVREVAKHPAVKSIVMCEIDEEVVNACKEHIPSLACGFDDPRLTLHIGDGLEFLCSYPGQFDVIITDSTDPVVGDSDHQKSKDGPAMSLFNEEYYTKLHEKLTPEGILCSQGESMWLHKELIGSLLAKSRTVYPVVDYAYTCTPSYPSGQIGLIMCSKNPKTIFREPVLSWTADELKQYGLKYYNTDIHSAAFTLPTFMQEFLNTL
uniref:Spermidine synthase-like n=1 Tax=Hirondellea gigas TaxID=1518452 RepID=A0A2P2HXJ7_9CRUS